MGKQVDRVAEATVRIYQRLVAGITVLNGVGLVAMIAATFAGQQELFYTGTAIMISSMAAHVAVKSFKIRILKRIIAAVEKK